MGGLHPDTAGDPATGGEEWVRWVDVTAQGFQLHASPLSVADTFAHEVAESGRAWILTSATLAVGGDFSLYQRDLGLADARTGAWDSPFDYGRQALLYVPRNLPPPNSREHTEAVVRAALPVLKASGGRAFLLFTTLRALDDAREQLAAAIARERLAGRCSRRAMAPRPSSSRASGSSATPAAAGQRELLGGRRRPRRRAVGRRHRQAAVSHRPTTRSSQRARAPRAAGGNPFFEVGAAGGDRAQAGRGRLIRTETDRGVLM
jgi:ATP-dependent DNA helicase DinG